MKDFFDTIPDTVQCDLIPDEKRRKVNAVLSPDTAELLCHFEIHKWATNVREKGWASWGGYLVANMLCVQIVLLGIAIQFYLHGKWGFQYQSKNSEDGDVSQVDGETWRTTESAVVRCIVKSWRPEATEAEQIKGSEDTTRKPHTTAGENDSQDSDDGSVMDDSEGQLEAENYVVQEAAEEAPSSVKGKSAESSPSRADQKGDGPSKNDVEPADFEDWSNKFTEWDLAKYLEEDPDVFPRHEKEKLNSVPKEDKKEPDILSQQKEHGGQSNYFEPAKPNNLSAFSEPDEGRGSDDWKGEDEMKDVDGRKDVDKEDVTTRIQVPFQSRQKNDQRQSASGWPTFWSLEPSLSLHFCSCIRTPRMCT